MTSFHVGDLLTDCDVHVRIILNFIDWQGGSTKYCMFDCVAQVCLAAVGLVGDLCRALSIKILPYTEQIMKILVEILSVSASTHTYTCIGRMYCMSVC